MDSLLSSVEELRTLIDKEEYQNGVNVCKQIIANDDDEEVPQGLRAVIYECLATCWLHLQEYQAVVDFSPNNKESSSIEDYYYANLQMLQAYALYRLERYHPAKVKLLLEQVVVNCRDSSFYKMLMAQIQYHLHETKEAFQLYDSMLLQKNNNNGGGETTSDEIRTEILTNALATLLADATPLVRDNSPQQHDDDDDTLKQLRLETLQNDEDYDGWYNLATWLHVTGTPSQTLLERARSACQKALAEVDGAISPAERQKELGPMETNLSWSQQWNGHNNTITTSDDDAGESQLLPASVVTIRNINKALALGDRQRALKALLSIQMDLNTWPMLHQRLWWYNCAALQLSVNNNNSLDSCRKSCKSLQGTLKSRKGAISKEGTADGGNNSGTLESEITGHWWQSRLDVLEALCLSKEHKKPKALDLLRASLTKLQAASKASTLSSSSSSQTLDHAMAHVQLHLFQLEHTETNDATSTTTTTTATPQDTIRLLESLPQSIRSQRAVKATLVSLYQSQGNESQASKLLQDDELAFADYCISQEKYEEAIDFLQKRIADYSTVGKKDDEKSTTLQVKLVEVLSHVDPNRAQKVLEQLSSELMKEMADDDDEDWSGEELEEREIPRSLVKAAWKQQQQQQQPTVVGLESKQDKNKKKEARLRRRANKRKEYLLELEKKGQYNPSHPTKPDPERWIPKHERSSSRRKGGGGRKGGGYDAYHHRGAQGGASERDAAKLDVAARQAAAKSGDLEANGRSTAHMTVSSSGVTRRAGRRR